MKKFTLPVFMFFSAFFLTSCNFDVTGVLDAAIDLYNSYSPSRGEDAPAIISISDYVAPSARGEDVSRDGGDLLTAVSTVSYVNFKDVTPEIKESMEKEFGELMKNSKKNESFYCESCSTCDDSGSCVFGNVKNDKVSKLMIVKDNGTQVQTVGLEGKFSKDKIVSLTKTGEIFDLLPYMTNQTR